MSLRGSIVRLAYTRSDLRPHLLPLLRVAMEHNTQDALDKYLKDHPGADKSNHSVKKQDKEDGGTKKAPKHLGEKALDSIKTLFKQPPKEMKDAQEAIGKATKSAFKDYDWSGAVDKSDPKNPKPAKGFTDKAWDLFHEQGPNLYKIGGPLLWAGFFGANYLNNPTPPGALEGNITLAVALGAITFGMGVFMQGEKNIDARSKARRSASSPEMTAKDLALVEDVFKNPGKPTKAEFEAMMAGLLKNHPEWAEKLS